MPSTNLINKTIKVRGHDERFKRRGKKKGEQFNFFRDQIIIILNKSKYNKQQSNPDYLN